MKHRLLLAAVLLCAVGSLHAQSWCPPGATWTYWFDGWGADYRQEYRYVDDTLFQGRMAHRCVVTMNGIIFGQPVQDTWTEFTATEGDAVLAWQNNFGSDIAAWDTLYWFGAVPGDRWWPPGEDRSCPPQGSIEVVDTGHVVQGGMLLRTLSLVQLGEEEQPITGTWSVLERIGMTPRYPQVISCSAIIDYYFPHFVCYSDNDIQVPGSVDCSIGLGVPEKGHGSAQLKLQPNPGTEGFALSDIGDRPAMLFMYDMQGRAVLGAGSVSDGEWIGTATLAKGSYVVEVRLNEGQVHRLRWVKQ